jgi:hypothetical protein
VIWLHHVPKESSSSHSIVTTLRRLRFRSFHALLFYVPLVPLHQSAERQSGTMPTFRNGPLYGPVETERERH